MREPDNQASKRDRGAAAVEFAIVLPLLLLVIGGVVDFGRAFYTQVTLTNAAREGARAVAVGTASAAATDRTRNAISSDPTSSLRLTATITGIPATGTCTPNTNVTVSISAPFDWIILQPMMNLVGGGSALPPTLSSSATMRCGG